MTLRNVCQQIETIADYSGRKDKESVIAEFQDDPIFRKVVNYSLNPFLKYNMSGIRYNPDPITYQEHQNIDSIFKMLDYLSGKNGASNDEKLF
jgi:hypothetical protein